jgi:hypothetical protein
MHGEVTTAHRAVLEFVRGWLKYAHRAVDYWGSEGRLEFGPLDGATARARADELFASLDGETDAEAIAKLRLELDNVMGRCDPVRLHWDGYILWNYAMLLMIEGRAATAKRLMDAAASTFEGREMPVEEMVRFFKDYAKALMGHDLTHRPELLKAELMLGNAADRNGGPDEETRELMGSLLDMEVARAGSIDDLKGLTGTNHSY